MHPIIIVMDRPSLYNDWKCGSLWGPLWSNQGSILYCFSAPPDRMPGSEHKGCSLLWRSFLYLRLVIFLQAYAGLWHVQTCAVWCSDFERQLSLTWCFVTCIMAAGLLHSPEPQPNTSAKQAQTLWTWCGEWQKWQTWSSQVEPSPSNLPACPPGPLTHADRHSHHPTIIIQLTGLRSLKWAVWASIISPSWRSRAPQRKHDCRYLFWGESPQWLGW